MQVHTDLDPSVDLQMRLEYLVYSVQFFSGQLHLSTVYFLLPTLQVHTSSAIHLYDDDDELNVQSSRSQLQ